MRSVDANVVRERGISSRYASGGGHLYLLGMGPMDTLPLLKQVEEGFEFAALERLQEVMGLPMESVAELANISPRTLSRRREQGRLMPDESDRLVRLARLFCSAIELFEGDIEGARRWFSSSLVALGGQSPLAFARTETGAREVENLIGRLEQGVFS